VPDMEDTVELHDIPFVARVEIDRKDPTRNRIMGYQGIDAPAAKPAAAAPAPAAKPAAGRKPWE
jgi:hypothetical protein